MTVDPPCLHYLRVCLVEVRLACVVAKHPTLQLTLLHCRCTDRERNLLESLSASSLFRRPGTAVVGVAAPSASPSFTYYTHACALFRAMVHDSVGGAASREAAARRFWSRSSGDDVQSPTSRPADAAASPVAGGGGGGERDRDGLRRARVVLQAADVTCRDVEAVAGVAIVKVLEGASRGLSSRAGSGRGGVGRGG